MNENIAGGAAKENVALPLSNENALKKRNNLLKSVVGVSVLATGLMMAPQNAFAQVAEQPAAIEAAQGEATQTTASVAGEKSDASDKGAVEGREDEHKKDAAEVKEASEKPQTVAADDALEIAEEKLAEAQKAGEAGEQKEEDKNLQKADDPNYGDDEAKIKDYDGSNRYKETDLQPGDTNQSLVKTDEKVEKDGFKFEIKNPSETSPSKTEYGYEITIDKKTGQRTYTRIDVTDGGKILVDPGNKPMMGQGDKLTP